MTRPWTTLSDGRVTAPGGTIPTLPPTEAVALASLVAALDPLVTMHSLRTGMPRATIFGIIWAETGFLGVVKGETALSPKGAIGRMQLMGKFWFWNPGPLGDHRAHTDAEMMHDRLNVWFGTDLLQMIQEDGNDLPEIASIYNCGPLGPKRPWTAKPSAKNVWGLCAEGAYIDRAVGANNTLLRASPPPAVSNRPFSTGRAALAAGAGLAVVWYLHRRGLR